MSIAEILGILGFSLSLFLGIGALLRYCRRLQMRIVACDVVWHSGTQSVVFFRIAFVNQSSRGRTVYRIANNRLPGIEISQVPYQYDANHQNITYLLPNDDGEAVRGLLPLDELLQYPLDILPHQSQAKWCALAFHWSNEWLNEVQEALPIYIYLQAEDVNDKKLAECEVNMTLEQLQTPNLYVSSPYPLS